MGKVGRFGEFGGQYVPETVMNAVHELEEAYDKYGNDPEFLEEYRTLLRDYAGRPSMLYYADRMTKDLGGCKIYLKREDLNHTGAHKINNVLGQILLAKKMGKKRIIAETGAGQHGVATATACAMFDMECEIYMGKEDVRRQRLNVYRMELLGAKVNSVDNGTATLKDAINEAMRDWATNIDTTFYLIGSVMGRTRIRPWCVTSRRSSAKRRSSRFWKKKADCRIVWLPASAAVPMPWVCSTISFRTRACVWWAQKLPERASKPSCTLPPLPRAVWAFSTA